MHREFEDRRERVLESVLKENQAFLVTNLRNIRYLTGFTGSFALLLLSKRRSFLHVDFRYVEQAKRETEIEVLEFRDSWLDNLRSFLVKNSIKKLLFESTCTYQFYKTLSKLKGIELKPKDGLIEKSRAIKSEKEIDYIREAVRRAERAFLKIKPSIKEGVTERDIANLLEYEIKREGSQTLPFPVIVASGENSSMPHWRSSERRLKRGDFVIIDWGAEFEGYYSDMTRTFIIGEASEKQIEIYNIVNRAREVAINSIKAGVKAKEIDSEARNLIKQSGYAKNFGHGTGHGVGLDVHEFPRINTKSKEVISPGMVFTVEPGIYIEGFGGVRVEDMVFVGKDFFEVLTTLPRELEIL